MKKVKFIKAGTRVGLGYSEGNEASINDEMADQLAEAGIVEIIENDDTEGNDDQGNTEGNTDTTEGNDDQGNTEGDTTTEGDDTEGTDDQGEPEATEGNDDQGEPEATTAKTTAKKARSKKKA